MLHRGPDTAGHWYSEDKHVGLFHRRLSIFDLSAAGNQPMCDETGVLSLVFNGEIYNFPELRSDLVSLGHQFRTSTDTEVILTAYREWGMACIERFNGMFAFGLYDQAERRLFLARDRVGEKPLFYRVADGSITFASELKALMIGASFPRRVDPIALDCFLAFGYVPGERCILEGVNKLPAAHALSFDLKSGDARTWRYWELPPVPETNNGDHLTGEGALLDELEFLLQDSVKKQLAADVPVGVLLSGGVDSSLTTAMAARSSARVKTFTISFPGAGEFDEAEHARLIARHFGTEHFELEAEPSSIELLPSLARQYDEPIVDSSMIPTYIVSKLVRQHCTVALGGDGGDELFGGYEHYNRLLWLQRRLGGVPHGPRRVVSGLASKLLPIGLKGRNWLQAVGVQFGDGLPLIATLFDAHGRARLIPGGATAYQSTIGAAECIRGGRIPSTPDLLDRATRMDFQNYLVDDILVKVDRASMLNSLEVRCPWLDYRLVEFAFGRVPAALKTTDSFRKILPKKLAQRILPTSFNMQRKQGFSIPLSSWLRGREWGSFFRDVLLGSGSGAFNPTFISALLKGQNRGRSNSERLFALVMFELWRREYNVEM